MDKTQTVQENQYTFPYHYIPQFDAGRFMQVRVLKWGVVYASYMSYVLEEIEKLPFSSLIDVGCGDGRFLFEASKRFEGKVLEGLDYSPRAISFAKAFNPDLTFYAGDISDETLVQGKYDIAVLIETLEHIKPLEIPNFLSGVARILEKDSTLIVTVPSDNTPVSAKHYQHFNMDLLEKTLAPHFKIERHVFVNKGGFLKKVIVRILSNRLFAINSVRLSSFLYRLYHKNLFPADEKTGERIVAFCKKA